MALIVPEVQFDYLDEGARRFLEALRSESVTDRWVVVHAPRFPDAPTPIPGASIDVIVDPSSAVLLVLSIPQQKIEYRADVGWVLGGIPADPYAQAAELEAAMRTYLEAGGINLSRSPVGHAVVFPNSVPPKEAPADGTTFDLNDLATGSGFTDRMVETLKATRVAPPSDGSVGRGAWPDYRLSPETAILIMARLISAPK